MINEKIEKRFMFDLEMGVFKNDYNKITGTPSIIFPIDKDYIKLLKILENNSFDLNSGIFSSYSDTFEFIEEIIYEFDSVFCAIYMNTRHVVITLSVDIINDIPEYVKEYELDE